MADNTQDRYGLFVKGELLDIGFGKTKAEKPFVILRVLERGHGATLRAIYHYGGSGDQWKGQIGKHIEIPVWIDAYVLNGQARMKFMFSTKRAENADISGGRANLAAV